LVPTYGGQIWAFDAVKLKEVWKFEDSRLASEFKNSVAIANDIAVACSGSRRLFALNLGTGQVLWQQALKRRSDSSPVIADQKVILATSDGRVLIYGLRDGKELWSEQLKGSFPGSPAVSQGRFVVASDNGTITCFGKANVN
jgi:outer membrane protein assembly factor BamB